MTSGFVRLGLAALILSVSALAAMAAEKGSFTDGQKAEMGTVIHDYLMENPQVIMEAVEKYRQNQEEMENKATVDKIKSSQDAIFHDPTSPVAGNKDGDVTLVEFFDYNCGYCKLAYKDVKTLLGEDKKLRVVFKDFPILSESSNTAARYALAADKQGKYWEFHQAVMEGGHTDDASMEKMGKDIGLDIEKWKKDADSPETRAIIEKNMSLARDLGFTGTPGFILGETPLRGHYGIDALRKLIAEQRGKKD